MPQLNRSIVSSIGVQCIDWRSRYFICSLHANRRYAIYTLEYIERSLRWTQNTFTFSANIHAYAFGSRASVWRKKNANIFICFNLLMDSDCWYFSTTFFIFIFNLIRLVDRWPVYVAWYVCLCNMGSTHHNPKIYKPKMVCVLCVFVTKLRLRSRNKSRWYNKLTPSNLLRWLKELEDDYYYSYGNRWAWDSFEAQPNIAPIWPVKWVVEKRLNIPRIGDPSELSLSEPMEPYIYMNRFRSILSLEIGSLRSSLTGKCRETAGKLLRKIARQFICDCDSSFSSLKSKITFVTLLRMSSTIQVHRLMWSMSRLECLLSRRVCLTQTSFSYIQQRTARAAKEHQTLELLENVLRVP